MKRFDKFIDSVLRFQKAQPQPSGWAVILAFATTVLLWAALTRVTWAHWGDITIDCGREAYVPWALSEGKKLYQDVWYPYGPAAPYFNALLYWLFGANVSVLYWAGSVSALASAMLLVLLGIRLSAIAGGWTAGIVLLIEGLAPGTIFSFPLAYSYSAVYGCVTTCLFVLFAVEAARSKRWGWMLAAGCAAACALTLKLEIGLANYGALAVLIALRGVQAKSVRRLGLDLLTTLPGIAGVGLVLVWIMPPGGLEFLVQQNWMSIPGTYFMRTYGAAWMSRTGGRMNLFEAVRALWFCIATTLIWLAFWWTLAREAKDSHVSRVRRALPAALLALILLSVVLARSSPGTMGEWLIAELFKLLFLPPVTFFFVLVAAALGVWACWRSGFNRQLVAIAVTFTASGLMGLRLLHNMLPFGYSIYSSGPAILSLFLLLRWLSIPFVAGDRKSLVSIDLILSVGMLGAVAVSIGSLYLDGMKDSSLVRTSRGSFSMPTLKAQRYAAALRFMEEKAARGEPVLAVPEDPALYFFSGMACPTRIYAFTPGVLTPGKMTEATIAEIERNRVGYLIWSNRHFDEYGVRDFGKDFDEGLGSYLTSHYRPIGSLGPGGSEGWTAVIWRRNGGAEVEPNVAARAPR